jgi:hypothetical protein
VGVVSGWMARSSRTPFAVIAFAGAVTMMPGLHIYRALGGALHLARLTNETDPAALAGSLGNAAEACLVVSGLALGLILGARVVLALGREPDPPKRSPSGSVPDAAVAPGAGRDCPPSESANCPTEGLPIQKETP